MAKKLLKYLKWLAMPLLIIGGLNWGLAIFDINLVTLLLGSVANGLLVKVVYGLVGVSALYGVYELVK